MSKITPKKPEKLSKIILWALISFSVFTAINIGVTLSYNNKINALEEKYSAQHAQIATAIEKTHPELKQIIEDSSTHEDFLDEFHSAQSNWLNAWIMVLTVILGIMGIAFPILFADKRKEIDDIIKNAEKKFDKIEEKAQSAIDRLNEADLKGKIAEIKTDMTQIKTWYEETEKAKQISIANSYFSTGNKLLSEDQYEDAIVAYQKAIKNYPDGKFLNAYGNMGIAFTKLGIKNKDIKFYNEAINAFNEAILIEPNNAKAHCGLGLPYAKLGKYKEAIEAIEKSIKLDSNYAIAYYNIAEAYIFAKQPDEALLALETFKQKPNPWMNATDREAWEKALQDCPQGETVEKLREIIKDLPDKK